MTDSGKRQMCPNEKAIVKILQDFDDFARQRPNVRNERLADLYDEFVRRRWSNGRTRLTNFDHLSAYSPVPGRLQEALDRVHCHYVRKTLVDEAADTPQELKPLHPKGELWQYALPIAGFSYGKYKSDRVYSAMWAVGIITGNRMGHVSKCLSLRLRPASRDLNEPPDSIVVRWGRRKGATTSSSVEYATDDLPRRVWTYVAEVWAKGDRPFSALKGNSPASCVNRWLREKRKARIDRRLAAGDAPLLTSSSPRIYGVNRDLDALERGDMTKERYEVRTAHTAAVAERTYRRPRTDADVKAPKARRNARMHPSEKHGKKVRS